MGNTSFSFGLCWKYLVFLWPLKYFSQLSHCNTSVWAQSRRSARLSLQSSELAPPAAPLHPQTSVAPPPPKGGTHSLAGEESVAGGSQFERRDTGQALCMVLEVQHNPSTCVGRGKKFFHCRTNFGEGDGVYRRFFVTSGFWPRYAPVFLGLISNMFSTWRVMANKIAHQATILKGVKQYEVLSQTQ